MMDESGKTDFARSVKKKRKSF